MRLKLSIVEKASTEISSIQAFISSALKKPESGVVIYSPSLKYRWAVSYIRLQEVDHYNCRDSQCVLEASTVGECQLKEQSSTQIIRREDFKFHHEISVCI